MKVINIIGATLVERNEQNGTYSAWYVCNGCGQELGNAECHKTQSEARSQALTSFDRQIRNYCYSCGAKLTDKACFSSSQPFTAEDSVMHYLLYQRGGKNEWELVAGEDAMHIRVSELMDELCCEADDIVVFESSDELL